MIFIYKCFDDLKNNFLLQSFEINLDREIIL